ncbi:MAG: hypothetical protein A2126_03030 [Candidatus Woykebacteria bacterium GWB1_45_5]|uniref:Uncharacterized protein n=2 Tax=Candidatus Woykeibacteriota TaxID=1817899 RepID=A0A1G1W045_9BACT|nr:MAG: hypothetical protein A2113_01550 [Candidatus Woykebacteria bacterium GWA1_44_8]OGY23560.1 MAG: hypothetical protein A2126_03030 [Candidatus Woykebacteria bacterium GWB1_45_5]
MDKDQSFKPLEGANRLKYYREHILQYAFLVIVLIASLFTLFQLRDFFWKLAVVFCFSLLYLVFGVWHHLEEKNHTSKHFLEYFLVAAIIFIILFSVFLD